MGPHAWGHCLVRAGGRVRGCGSGATLPPAVACRQLAKPHADRTGRMRSAPLSRSPVTSDTLTASSARSTPSSMLVSARSPPTRRLSRRSSAGRATGSATASGSGCGLGTTLMRPPAPMRSVDQLITSPPPAVSSRRPAVALCRSECRLLLCSQRWYEPWLWPGSRNGE